MIFCLTYIILRRFAFLTYIDHTCSLVFHLQELTKAPYCRSHLHVRENGQAVVRPPRELGFITRTHTSTCFRLEDAVDLLVSYLIIKVIFFFPSPLQLRLNHGHDHQHQNARLASQSQLALQIYSQRWRRKGYWTLPLERSPQRN